MEHVYTWLRDALEHVQHNRDTVKNKLFFHFMMRIVAESELNAGIVGQSPPPQIANKILGENVAQHLVSSVTVNNL